ncbi:hypothetical protein ACFUOZ_07355 [Paenarthrobacter sp. NPDC057355]|uniref:hypothetical protein n=1 Tax=Paenarthrobacter sp. NPDC057355 TaxID=3346105 RepID=UPI00364232D0
MPYHEPSHNEPINNGPAPARSTRDETGPSTVKVIPAVDLYLGTVTILTRNRPLCFRYPQARHIAEALARAVRPSTWCEATGTLTVTVAAVGHREGRPCTFTLSREPSREPSRELA